ncbi:MAG TPA: DUF5652 family protein [Candidatus Limnocylindrales bacterium]|nr:DUF5652 family protein [Candidatus Limnocylindrales bacterium]
MYADARLFRIALIMAIVTAPLKGWAQWRAARAEQKGWFIAILLLNTFGILELTYLFYFSKPAPKGPTEDSTIE